MKKIAILACSLLATCSLMLTACGDNSNAQVPTTVPTTEAHIHAFGEWITVKETTCTERGEQERVCSCGEKETQSVDIIAHTFGEWSTIKEATCTEKGEQERACSCGEKETQNIDMVAHAEVTDEAVAPTCTETGLTEGQHCSVCNKVIVAQETVKANGHSFGVWTTVKEATCAHEGQAERVCSCGEKETQSINAVAHTFSDWLTIKDAKCEENGLLQRYCSVCNYTESKPVDAIGHTVEKDEAVAPTCTQTGLTEGSSCSACGEVVIPQTVVSMLPHTEGAWIIDEIPTLAGAGLKHTECIVCDEKVSEQSISDGSVLTIAEALQICQKIGSLQLIHLRFYITANVETVTDSAYGAMIINDGTGSISVYDSKNADGTVSYADMAAKPFKGDEVTIYCTLQNYDGYARIKSAWIVEFKGGEKSFDDYTEMSVADARNTVAGTKVKVTGVVACITYAAVYKPNGVILVDGTNSIYICDVDLADRVAIGNTITVAATKTYWILESDVANANKFGYKGCNQLESAWLLNNDNGNSDFDKTWITDSTVKEIVDTPVSQDISTTIFKVTAQIKKVSGNGFVNYYIYDLDGVTGSYVYTQCYGADFSWMDEFDGKICTVYLMALNAKTKATDCCWRFLPIDVIDESIDVSSVNIPQNALELFTVSQFELNYNTTFNVDLLAFVSNELLKYPDANMPNVIKLGKK